MQVDLNEETAVKLLVQYVELAQQKVTEARQFYQKAWDQLLKNPDASDESKRLLKIKLDAVGGRS